MTVIEQIGSAIGAGLASAGVVTVLARQWISKRAEKKLDALSVEVGVGTEGPSLLSLVATTASATERIEKGFTKHGEVLDGVLRAQELYGVTLEDHGRRLGLIEVRHDSCGLTNERIAEILALKTEQVAKELSDETKDVAAKLAAKTERVAEVLTHHPPVPERES